MSRTGRATPLLLLVFLATLLVGAEREVALGRSAVAAAEAASASGELTPAIDAAHEAAEARLLGSPYPDRGYALLAAIARQAEAHGDVQTAASAFRAMRAAALATRTFGRTPSWAATANEGLARIAGHTPAATALADPVGVASQTAAALAEDDAPSGGTFLAVGIFGVIVALVLLRPGLAQPKKVRA